MMPPLDLNDKDDRKLFQEGCKGLLEKDMFTGSKTEYGNWVKLIETDFESTRTMEHSGFVPLGTPREVQQLQIGFQRSTAILTSSLLTRHLRKM